MRLDRLDSGLWRATYLFPQPVETLVFDRNAAWHRESVWSIETPGYSWERTEAGEQALRRAAEASARTEIALRFRSYDEPLEKEYQLFQTFSDGSLAVYTGHFHATATGEGDASGLPVRTLRVAPPPGGHLAGRGRLFRETTDWTDPDGDDGTYLYLGAIEPIETDHVLAILDPGLPAWILARLDEQLPWYFETYAKRLAVPLPWKPTVLLSFPDSTAPGSSSKGGVLTGLVAMSLRGRAWLEPDSDREIHIAFLFAHEAAHFWNGQVVTYPGSGEAWLHEGSADAFAYRLLRERGIIAAERNRERLATRLRRCADGLSHGPLSGAAERGSFDLYYSCGEIAALWTELVLPEGEDLFSFWRALVEAAQKAGGDYDPELYFEVLGQLGATDERMAPLRRFVSEPLHDPFAFLLREFPRAGWLLPEASKQPPPGERSPEGSGTSPPGVRPDPS